MLPRHRYNYVPARHYSEDYDARSHDSIGCKGLYNLIFCHCEYAPRAFQVNIVNRLSILRIYAYFSSYSSLQQLEVPDMCMILIP